MLSALGKCLKGIVNGGGSRRGGKSRNPSLKRGYALFKNVLSGVGQTAVNISGVPEAETVGGVLRIVKNKGGGRINGYGAGVGCGVGLFLANLNLAGFKALVCGIFYIFKV